MRTLLALTPPPHLTRNLPKTLVTDEIINSHWLLLLPYLPQYNWASEAIKLSFAAPPRLTHLPAWCGFVFPGSLGRVTEPLALALSLSPREQQAGPVHLLRATVAESNNWCPV